MKENYFNKDSEDSVLFTERYVLLVYIVIIIIKHKHYSNKVTVAFDH